MEAIATSGNDGGNAPSVLTREAATDTLQRVILAAKRVAAEEVMPRFLKVAHQRKADGSLFTDADLAAQDALTRALREIHDVPVVGEEMSREAQVERWLAGEGDVWCVDPIDGTSNFVYGLPYFAVSVALLRRGRSVLGVVYAPVTDEMFYAERGCGAFLNGERLPIRSSVPRLRNAMANVDFKRVSVQLAEALASAPPYMSQRNYGAATLEWCYLAAGRFDLYLHGGQKLWDYAAGCVVLEEAGGHACTLTRDDFWGDDLWKRSVVAALDPGLFQSWRDWVRQRL